MLDKELFNTVKELVDVRYPSGWGGAAAGASSTMCDFK